MLATYHNHTTFSDGKVNVPTMVAAALDLGVNELGISDHLMLHERQPPPKWSMQRDDLGRYIDTIRNAATPDGPTLRIGLEVDYFPGQEAHIAHTLRDLPLDYIIGSVHYVGDFTIDSSAAAWQPLTDDEREAIHLGYWQRMLGLAQSGLFDIVAHLDLSKKFGYLPRRDLSRDMHAALDAIADAGLVVELNTAGWHKPCADAYPTLALLRECRQRSIPTTLSSDAHQPDHLVRDFVAGAQRLAEAGYDTVARFAGRERRFEPLVSALPT